MDNPQLPDMEAATSELSKNNRLMASAVDHLLSEIDSLLEASKAEDWEQVETIGKQIAESSERSGFPGLSDPAHRVIDEAHQPNNEHNIKKSVLRLVGRSGAPSHQLRKPT